MKTSKRGFTKVPPGGMAPEDATLGMPGNAYGSGMPTPKRAPAPKPRGKGKPAKAK